MPPASRKWRKRSRRAMRGCFGCRFAWPDPSQSFRDGPEDQTRNLEIPGSLVSLAPRNGDYLTHKRLQIGGQVTILQEGIDGTRGKIDWTKPVLWLFAACMVVLIVMPLSWLAVYSVTDKAHHLTLQNFVTLFTDPDFLDPLLTTAIIATASAAICCVVAAPMGWLVSRTDMPGRQFIRALVTASFVTPPFLGAVAWELLAAPNSGLLNQLFRLVTDAEADEHL